MKRFCVALVVLAWLLVPQKALAQNNQASQSLTLTIVQHKVNLSWSASTSSGVVSYNVYRGTKSGGPYTKLGGTSVLVYADIGALSGNTYYYVVTAVNSSNVESADSNQATAIIPTP
jgi:fibronectin type 3 domain-containing protein